MTTPRGVAILEAMRSTFVQLAELERTSPGEADEIIRVIVNHIRSWRPMALLIKEGQ